MPKYHVACGHEDKSKQEFNDKREYTGEHANEAEAKAAWTALNGLEGIGLDKWPVKVTELKEGEAPPKPPVRSTHADHHKAK